MIFEIIFYDFTVAFIKNICNISSSQDNLLSDEEAKEIKKLLSPSDNDQLNTSDWMSEVLSIESNDNVNNQRFVFYESL